MTAKATPQKEQKQGDDFVLRNGYIITGNHNEINLSCDLEKLEATCAKMHAKFCENFFQQIERNNRTLKKIEALVEALKKEK